MKPLIVANWKMNPSTEKEAKELFEKVKEGIKDTTADVVICPPFVYLPLLKGLTLGAQNLFYEEKGAFTGEISEAMLKDLGVLYVIVGHSERRKNFAETDELINKKIKEALYFGLQVILCIGETKEQRDAKKKREVLEHQIREGLLGIQNTEHVIVAYEPVWAIGTGESCSVQETKESVAFIKSLTSTQVKILYGGSVTDKNASEYIKNAGVDGLLVGGASLKPDEFINIVKSAQ